MHTCQPLPTTNLGTQLDSIFGWLTGSSEREVRPTVRGYFFFPILRSEITDWWIDVVGVLWDAGFERAPLGKFVNFCPYNGMAGVGKRKGRHKIRDDFVFHNSILFFIIRCRLAAVHQILLY